MHPFEIQVTDYQKALRAKNQVELGHHFVFVENGRLLSSGGREQRLLGHKTRDRRLAVPLVEDAVEVSGVRVLPTHPRPSPLAAIVADRDLYRAEEDPLHLFIAAPGKPEGLVVKIEKDGAELSARPLELGGNGVMIQTLALLLPGSYVARLYDSAGAPVGNPARFTVAEYTLAPLSGRLIHHELDRGRARLTFALGVESYQIPFDRPLSIELIDGDVPVAQVHTEPKSPGRFEGELSVSGNGPFRLRLTAADDAQRVAEVALPGSRTHETTLTLVSELGTKQYLSMMPEPDALPVRGGFITAGDHLATPITVESVVAKTGRLQVHADVEGLALVIVELETGTFRTVEVGDKKAGEDVELSLESSVCTVFVGGYVGGSPFEGYTSFFREESLQLAVDVCETARPGETVEIQLSVAGTKESTPVLLSVRDERLTAQDTPSVALGSSAKQAIAALTRSMGDGFDFRPIGDWIVPPFPVPVLASAGILGGGLSPRSLRRRALGSRETARPPAGPAGLPAFPAAGMALNLEPPQAAPHVAIPASFGAGVLDADPVAERATKERRGDVANPVDEDSSPAGRHGQGALPADGGETRTHFPEVLFYGLVPVHKETRVVIPLSDALATYAVEAFAVAGGDWCLARRTLTVDQPVRIDLEIPPAVHPQDRAYGTLRANALGGRARITLRRNGEAVALGERAGPQAGRVGGDRSVNPKPIEVHTPCERHFLVRPGTYTADVEDLTTQERDSVQRHVGTPGRFKSHVRQLELLEKGRTLTLETEDAIALRVLPSLDEPFKLLTQATAEYTHLCCEQTAAKILSAVTMYLSAEGPATQKRAEEIILAGIARERRMLIPGRGFCAYPESREIYLPYSRLTTRRLWSLHQLKIMPKIEPALRRAVKDGLQMADDVGQAHGMHRVPARIDSIEDAYAAAITHPDKQQRQKARAFADAVIDGLDGSTPRPDPGSTLDIALGLMGKVVGTDRGPWRGAVNERAHLAYAAAILLALGELARALPLANRVTRQFNDRGGLYSTVDSVAALALMIQLRIAGVGSQGGRVRVNGTEMTVQDAVGLSDRVESVEVVDGVVPVEITRIKEEDWATNASSMPMAVGFQDAQGHPQDRFSAGDKTHLVVKLSNGYTFGDLVHVALPAAMSWIRGGGKVKRFTLDFEGKAEVSVPLVVTERIEGQQRFAVCTRNMFEEERMASPGLLSIHGSEERPTR